MKWSLRRKQASIHPDNGLRWRGDFDLSEIYYLNDMVAHRLTFDSPQDVYYVVNQPPPGSDTDDTEYWTKMPKLVMHYYR